MPERIPQSATIRVPFQAYLAADHITAATGKTIAVTISKNGGAYGNPSAGATNATEIANGSYYVDLSTTDTGTVGPLWVRGAVSSVDDVIAIYSVAKATNAGFTALPDAVAGANNGLPILSVSGTTLGYTVTTVTTTATATNLTNLPTAPTDWLSAAAVSAAAVTKVQAGLSTYAGGAVASVTAGVTVTTNNDKTGYSLNLAQTLSAARAVTSVADTALTLNDAMHCAVAATGGQETTVGTAYTTKTSAGTVLRLFALDSATDPTTRT